MKSLSLTKRNTRRLGLLLAVPPLALLYCSGGGVEFTIVNETNEALYTWAFYEQCEDSPGNQQDYFVQDIVEARESFEYRYGFGSSSGSYPDDDVRCVQVADEQRRLVLSVPYEQGKRYVVTDPTPIRREPLPAVYELPRQSWSDGAIEEISENPAAYAVLAPFLTALFVMLFIALPYGIYRSVKDLLRYRREGASQEK